MIAAEREYLFAHALVRDAAYDLQTVDERAALHGLAVQVLEEMFPRADRGTVAREIARHAGEAFKSDRLPAVPGPTEDVLALAELRAVRVAADDAEVNFDVRESSRLWREVAEHELSPDAERLEAWMRAADALRHAGRYAEARHCVQKAGELAEKAPDIARCLIADANLLRLTGELREAEARARQSIELVHKGKARADALHNLAMILRDTGGADCEMMFRDAMEIHRKDGDELAEAKVAGGLASYLSDRGLRRDAEKLYRRALELHSQAGDPRGEGIYLGNLGILCAEDGRFDEAGECYERALAIHRDLGNRADEALVSGNFAILLKQTGRTQQAELNYRRALGIFRELGNRPMEARYMLNLANLLDDTGRTVQAVGMYEMALDILRDVGQARTLGVCLGNLGLARQKLGRLDAAYRAMTESIDLLVKLEARVPAGAFLSLRGKLMLLLGEEGSAEGDFLEAQALLKESAPPAFRAQFLMPLKVRLMAHRGEYDAAERCINEAAEELSGLDPESEPGRAMTDARETVREGRDGKLVNGYRPAELSKELRRAVAERIAKSNPEAARDLDIQI